MKNIKLLAILLFSFTVFLSCKKEEATSVEKTSIAPENLATASFTIDGMTCPEGCAKVIENKLVGLEGVSEAKVDFENKTATITYDNQKQTPESLTETVEKVGGGDLYKVSNIKSSKDKAFFTDKEKKKKKKSKAEEGTTEKKEEKKSCCAGKSSCSDKKETGTL